MKNALLFGVHGHQPVGNFDSVIVDAHERCYRPFILTLYRYPAFHFSIHFSGWLMEILLKKFPQDMAVLKEMVMRGQAELFSSGHYEPVLSSIPMADRIGQLRQNAEFLQREFGQEPHGAWLTERVWEAGVVPALVKCGVRYITVDDYHFFCAGKTKEEIDGYFLTEEGGEGLALFPISELLRYHLPFTPAPDAVHFLEEESKNNRRASVYFDDIEKFGIWPETWEWVYGKRWLESFIETVLASDHVETKTYSEFHSAHPARGIIYLPTVSYAEMNEWTLPKGQAEIYADLLHREQSTGSLAASKPFIRGGTWRNFFSLYPESNWMHKRMIGLSRRLSAARHNVKTDALRRHLFAAQSNDAYWHGLFGGLYLPHLRRAVWNNLIAVETGLNAQEMEAPIWRGDLDLDGTEELILARPEHKAVIRLDGLAAVQEFDARSLSHNFGDSLRRYAQPYFAKFTKPAHEGTPASGIASAHDRAALKDKVSPEELEPDEFARRLLLDFRVSRDGTRNVIVKYALVPADAHGAQARFIAQAEGWQIVKSLQVDAHGLDVKYLFSGEAHERFETELNLAMPSCDGYSGRYTLENGDIPCGFGQALDVKSCTKLTLDDRVLGGGIMLLTNVPVAIHARPHFTVSQSEAGLEKIMQSACLTLSWAVPGPESELRLMLRPYRDSAAATSKVETPSSLRVWFSAAARRIAGSSRP